MVWVGTAVAGGSAILGYLGQKDATDAARDATAAGRLYVPTAFMPGGAYGIYGGINPASPGVASLQSMPGGNPLIGGSGYAGPQSSFAAPGGGGNPFAYAPPAASTPPPTQPVRGSGIGGLIGNFGGPTGSPIANLIIGLSPQGGSLGQSAAPTFDIGGPMGSTIGRLTSGLLPQGTVGAQQNSAPFGSQAQIAQMVQQLTAGRAPGGSLGQAGGQYVVSTGGDAMQGGEVNMVAGGKPGFDMTGGYGSGNPAMFNVGGGNVAQSVKNWGSPTGAYTVPYGGNTGAAQGAQPTQANPFVPVQDPSYIQYHGAPAPGGSVASPIDTTVVGSAGDLEPTRQMLRDISLSQGVDPGVAGALQSSATANLYGGNTPGMASAYLDLLRQQAQPYESRAMNQVNQNLFSRGRLGAADTVTGEAYTGLARGFSEADVARQRLALDFGSTEAQNVFGRGLAAAQTGSALQGDALQRILAASGGAQEIGRYGTLPLELALQFGVARSNAALGQASNLTAMAGQPSGGYQLANLFGGLVGSGAFAGLGGKK